MKHVLLYAVMLTFTFLALAMKSPWIKYPMLVVVWGDYLVINYLFLTRYGK